MTADEYAAARRRIGTQEAVAKLLGVNRVTLANRERGKAPISREASMAMESLARRISGGDAPSP